METKEKINWDLLDLICTIWVGLSIVILLALSFNELGFFNSEFIKSISKLKLPWQKSDEVLVLGIKEKTYTPEEFVRHVGKKADSLKITSLTKISLEEGESVSGADEKFAKIEPFKSEWEFTELKPYYKVFIFYITFICKDGSKLPVPGYKISYTEFIKDYKPGDKFVVVSPKPKYVVYFDGKIYLLGQELKLWHRRY